MSAPRSTHGWWKDQFWIVSSVRVSELACTEATKRKMQMTECRHRERMGQVMTHCERIAGKTLIAKTLSAHVTQELCRETNVLKESRKMRKEERGVSGGVGNVSAKSLQSTIDNQPDEIKMLNSEHDASTDSGRQGAKGSC